MKTFQEFITEARGKFRGHRTPEEIAKVRKKRQERQTIETEDTPTNERIRDAAQQAAIKAHKENNSEKARSYMSLGFLHTLPQSQRYTPTDTRGRHGRGGQHFTKELERKINQAKKEEEGKQEVLPSEHPDANFSSPEAAKKADKTHEKRVKARRRLRMPSRQEHKAKQREEEKRSRSIDREFRRTQLQKTVGKIPGQLS
jgi:hypothetical protein